MCLKETLDEAKENWSKATECSKWLGYYNVTRSLTGLRILQVL